MLQLLSSLLVLLFSLSSPAMKGIVNFWQSPLAAEGTAAAEENFVTLYRQGNPDTVYSSSKPVSTSLSSDLTHYDPAGQLLEFKVPQQTFDQWRLQGHVETFNDLHLPTGIITPETRILPPASGQLNQFLIKPQ